MNFSVLWTLFGATNILSLAFIHVKNMASSLTGWLVGWLSSVCSICRSVDVHCVCAYGPVGLQSQRHECRACNPINQRRQIKLPRAAKRCISIRAVIITWRKRQEKSPSCVEYICLHIRTMNDQICWKKKWLYMQKWKKKI